jgi:pimeloyl-ACP methyl ester carboxylesterase/class 3 adenylate cyclase
MNEVPEVQYATAPDGASIAFQVVGSGPDVLYMPGFATQLSAFWDFPVYFYSMYLERMASFCRLLVFDTRGAGMSDPLPDAVQSIDDQVADLVALLDAAGIEQTSVVAELNAGPSAIRLAAEHPERVRSLVLNMTYARLLEDDGYPGITPEANHEMNETIASQWGTGFTVGLWSPELAGDPRLTREMGHFERLGASPARFRALARLWAANDARADLERVAVPTLVMHDRDNMLVPTEYGRYLAAHIPDSKFVEYEGVTEIPLSENALIQTSIICEFLTGTRVQARVDRILGVMVFFDVVGSTAHLLARGDHEWRADIESFRRSVEDVLGRDGGRLVNTRGDDIFVLCVKPTLAIAMTHDLRVRASELGFEIRGGIHVAEVEDTGDDVLGLGVHVAARVCDLASAGEVWVTEAVRSAVLGGVDTFEPRGEHELKGIPGSWALSAVVERG